MKIFKHQYFGIIFLSGLFLLLSCNEMEQPEIFESTPDNLTGLEKSSTVPPDEVSPPEDLALNPGKSGYPHPLESDRGWGGGSNKWEIVDGVRNPTSWAHGLAFTGGTKPYIEPCGWRQAIINFGEPTTFNRLVVWHNGLNHVPKTYKIQYLNGTDWVEIFSTNNGHDYLKYPADPQQNWWENSSTENTFTPVTSNKVKFLIENCDITHGWIYELEVYYDEMKVPVDIKPQSCPNPLNMKSKGVLSVAILGTDNLDVSQINPGSLRLEGVPPLRWSQEDVATPFVPFTGKEACTDCTSEGADGYLDLTLKFNIQDVVQAVGEVNDGECRKLSITGELEDGTPVAGEDIVVILNKGEK